jgi:hypothetical protein
MGELIEFQFNCFETVSTENSTYNQTLIKFECWKFCKTERIIRYKLIQFNVSLKSNKIPDVELKIYKPNLYKTDGGKNEIILPMILKLY